MRDIFFSRQVCFNFENILIEYCFLNLTVDSCWHVVAEFKMVSLKVVHDHNFYCTAFIGDDHKFLIYYLSCKKKFAYCIWEKVHVAVSDNLCIDFHSFVILAYLLQSWPLTAICKLFNVFDFFSRTTWPILTKLGSKHPWVQGIQISLIKGQALF